MINTISAEELFDVGGVVKTVVASCCVLKNNRVGVEGVQKRNILDGKAVSS